MAESTALMIVVFIPILIVLGWVLHSVCVQPRMDRKAERKSHEEFEKDWNTYM